MKTVSKKLLLGITGATLLLIGGVASAFLDSSPLELESLESLTVEGKPVLNRITWTSSRAQDVWTMKQSHTQGQSWDHLEIVIDKTVSPPLARYYQYEPGSARKLAPYRVACFTCHTNGPRAIRPKSSTAWNQVRAWVWNARIKTYGRIQGEAGIGVPTGGPTHTPFRYASLGDNRKLTVRTCMTCHQDSRWGRGELTRQNGHTMRFMVDQGFMPPPGFALPPEEKKELDRFVIGT